ncbi:hypothetical protein VTK73DRAFT_10083 [Phialemonium thermophilum]|uniref:Stc1 domain-containing protein n=1 Tax=Phialemonium thermophilum TaxID=223376 RepID=A0ABR3XHA8_9PEZI
MHSAYEDGLSHGDGLPDKIKCELGGEWRPLSQFSKSQLRKYRISVRSNKTVIPSNSKISCRVHKGGSPNELQCEGPCNTWRALQFFSKRTRADGINWCKECTEWAQSIEPGAIPPPPPLADRSPDEEEESTPQAGNLEDDMIFGHDADHDVATIPENSQNSSDSGSTTRDLAPVNIAMEEESVGHNQYAIEQPRVSSPSSHSSSGRKSIIEEFVTFGPDGQDVVLRKRHQFTAGNPSLSSSSTKEATASKDGWLKTRTVKQLPNVA